MNPDQIKQDWLSKGYSFGVFRDPPGQVWADFVHKTDELVVLAEGVVLPPKSGPPASMGN